jgi:hypothetical protein
MVITDNNRQRQDSEPRLHICKFLFLDCPDEKA